jgi:hypothetical protein
MEIDFQKKINIFGYVLEPCKKSGDFFLNFDQILAIENLIKHLIIPFFIFNIIFCHI